MPNIAFGVLMIESIEQTIERAATKAGNKGVDAAMSAIEMVNLLHMIFFDVGETPIRPRKPFGDLLPRDCA